MSGERDFRALVDEAFRALGRDDALLPRALALATERHLAVDGASLSVMALGVRVPLGAGSPASALAERLQFTSGDGPCLEAMRSGVAVRATAEDLQQRWPVLADTWTTQTPFRSAMSLPLDTGSQIHVALNLFFAHSDDGSELDTRKTAEVIAEMSEQLFLSGDTPAGSWDVADSWLAAPAAIRRQRLWIALGIVTMATGLNTEDAAARLRAHALTHDQTLDDVTDQIIRDPTSADRLAP